MKIEDVFTPFVMMIIGTLIGMWGYLFPLELKFNPGRKEKEFILILRGMAIVFLLPLIAGFLVTLTFVPISILLWIYAKKITELNYSESYKKKRLIAGKYTFLGIAVFSILFYYFHSRK